MLIFFDSPRYKHNWRYHKDLRLWLTKEAGTEPTQKTQSYERGSYIVFDPSSWERVRKDMLLVSLASQFVKVGHSLIRMLFQVFDSLERR